MQVSSEAPKPKVARSTKAGLKFSISRIENYIRKHKFADRLSSNATVYLSAVLEYLAAEVLELSGHAAKDYQKRRIAPKHIQLAIKHDEELSQILGNITISTAGHFSLIPEAPPTQPPPTV